MQDKTIIAISGLKRVGKDTAAKHINKLLNNQAVIIPFAEPLHDFIYKSLAIPEDADKEEPSYLGMSPRLIMQSIGTKAREMDPDFFVNVLARKIEKSKKKYIIISDVRRANEAHFIRGYGGKILHIKRNTQIKDSDDTEQGISIIKGDRVIYNNSDSLDIYLRRIEKAAKDYFNLPISDSDYQTDSLFSDEY